MIVLISVDAIFEPLSFSGGPRSVSYMSTAEERVQRVLCPIHGLIVFRDSLDHLAWDLLNSPEVQRLRRIKQLGLSELVFPGATHTRFAHSIGVFEMARQLIEIIERELPTVDRDRADVAVIAALLHDIGHGPFSHAFEGAEKARGINKKHEKWSAEMVLNPSGGIMPIFDRHSRSDLGRKVADLLTKEVPEDIYDAVVSSSFDADRLDYLQRDRNMTGTGAGAIDFEWLLDNLTVADIDVEPDGESGEVLRPSFCLRQKALQAAEAFLLARHHLYTQIYLHKTTRGGEQMVGALLRAVTQLVNDKKNGHRSVNLPPDHPLVRYLRADEPILEDYLSLDDTVVWGAIERMEDASDKFVRELAQRLRRRDLFKGIDLEAEYGSDPEIQRRHRRRLDNAYAAEMGRSVLKDEGKLTIYGEIGADDAKAHKRLMILMPGNQPKEITSVSDAISALVRPKPFVRYYFETDSAREAARAA